MNTLRVLAGAALMLTGMATAHATDVAPAWRSPGFVMEEIVVTARLEDLPARLAMRTRFIRNMRNVLHF
jgi:hypothetical protein